MKIALDIGHGQDNRTPGVFDPGAVSGGVREHDEAKLTMLPVVPLLRAHGHEVMVIDGGQLSGRQERARSWGAHMLVSGHLNAGGGTGTETFVHEAATAASERLAVSVQRRMVAALGLRDRGVKRGRLAVLAPPLTSCLLEFVFIDNPGNVVRLKARRPELVRGIADGILDIAGRKEAIPVDPDFIYEFVFLGGLSARDEFLTWASPRFRNRANSRNVKVLARQSLRGEVTKRAQAGGGVFVQEIGPIPAGSNIRFENTGVVNLDPLLGDDSEYRRKHAELVAAVKALPIT